MARIPFYPTLRARRSLKDVAEGVLSVSCRSSDSPPILPSGPMHNLPIGPEDDDSGQRGEPNESSGDVYVVNACGYVDADDEDEDEVGKLKEEP